MRYHAIGLTDFRYGQIRQADHEGQIVLIGPIGRQGVGKSVGPDESTGRNGAEAVAVEGRTKFGQGVVERPVAISHDSQGQGPLPDRVFS